MLSLSFERLGVVCIDIIGYSLEMTWLALGAWIYVSDIRWFNYRQHLPKLLFLFVLGWIDRVPYNYYLPKTVPDYRYSEPALFIDIVVEGLAIWFLYRFKTINPYVSLLVIAGIEYISLAVRILIRF